MPAVTRVDECTNAETGVGAAIAAGSHAEKGIWALFVKAVIIIKMTNRKLEYIWVFMKFQWLLLKASAIARISKASPIRLVRAVSIPAPSDLLFK